MRYILVLLGIVCSFKDGWTLSWSDKVIFYQDCEIFKNPDLYGGPICGTDSETYANSLYLDCMNYQTFQNVGTLHSGSCLPMDEYCKANLFYKPVCGSDGNTYTNLESLLCVNYKRSQNVTVTSKEACENLDHCYRHGITFYGTNPVCGSNGFTYQNAAQLKCLQRRNTDLKILYDGGCTTRDVYNVYGHSEKVCEIAKTRYEWNPVCASDGITYSNPFEFLCYEADMNQLVSDGECGTSTQNSCAQLELADTASKNSSEAFTPEDEVCGSDGVTYQSTHHLQCYSSRNKYLSVKHSGPCSGPDDSPCGNIPEEDLRLPVCGSDSFSYVSPEALWCAKLRFPVKQLMFVHDGPC
ncbi:serine protease inhibitor dipetalogastin-like [Osmia lignaria lignaria]|uniref:serine protease inhibitor dipetalogastin-like n=1 Tax=Osmia lignaria lignaria TaxID=1437193 RepID=UPI00402BF2A2